MNRTKFVIVSACVTIFLVANYGFMPPVENECSPLEKVSLGISNKVDISTQCKGYTQKGARCKRRTNATNGYCYQHGPNKDPKTSYYKNPSSSSSSLCGARTKSGSPCKRKVKDGGKCYQH